MSDFQDIEDPRAGLPSASAAERLAECPASFQLDRRFKAFGLSPCSPFKDMADFGTLVHRVLEIRNSGLPIMTEDEGSVKDMADRCEKLADQCTAEWLGGLEGDIADTRKLCEQRAWLVDGSGNRLGSAQADLIHIIGKHALVIDYKSGFLEVEEAVRNWQMAAIAACVACELGLESVECAVIQPMAGGTGKRCRYETEDGSLQAATKEVAAVFSRALGPQDSGALKAGTWCRTCPAAVLCPKLKVKLLEIAGVTTPLSPDIPDAEIVQIMGLKSALEQVCDHVSEHARMKLLAGIEIPGLKLGHRTTKNIPDMEAFAGAVGMPSSSIASMFGKVRWNGELEKWLKESASVDLERLKSQGIVLETKSFFAQLSKREKR